MRIYNIIVLSQTDNSVSLYVHQFKYGYRWLHYFCQGQDVTCIELDRPEITIKDLAPGQYYFYCRNAEGEETGDVEVDISYETKTERYRNVLLFAGLQDKVYTDITDKLATDDPVPELYAMYRKTKEDTRPYEELLRIFANDHNVRQENLNLFPDPLFTFDKTTGAVISRYQVSYTFVPSQYDINRQDWHILQDKIVYDASLYQIDEKPAQLYRISVLSDGNLIRRFYIYQPSETYAAAILEDRIRARKTRDEQTAALSDLGDVSNDKHKTAAAILQFDLVKPVLQCPEIELKDENSLQVTIPDYGLVTMFPKKIYLAALETGELYAETPCPHKIEITEESMSIRRTDFLVNADTEYVFYLVDEKGTRLSQATLISFNENFPVEECIETYRKIQYERYLRKLYGIFQAYDPADWGTIASLADRYFLGIASKMPFTEFLISQIAGLDTNHYRIGYLVQLVLLCKLRFFTDVDQDFISQQVYAKAYKCHVLPRSDTAYLVRVMRINGNAITYEHYLSGNGAIEIRMDRDDMLAVQCLDMDTWKSSSVAFYNNRYAGPSYFYFPNLEVTVDDKLI